MRFPREGNALPVGGCEKFQQSLGLLSAVRSWISSVPGTACLPASSVWRN